MSNIEKMLFVSMKLKLMSLFVSENYMKNITGAYALAWSAGIYPALDDCAGWHEEFDESFRVSKDQLLSLHKFLADRWENSEKISFNDLERHCHIPRSGQEGPIWSRHLLIAACRYFFLHKLFDKEFWDTLLETGRCPGEANGIRKDFHPEDVYFC